jgi:hypothetical protein
MLIFPQLTTGALAQFPSTRSRWARTVTNTLSDMTTIKLADPSGGIIEWRLAYTGLTDNELSNLEAFFEATEGSLNVFAFVDPIANLLAWSDHLDEDAWTTDPFISLTGNVTDPTGGANAWQITNAGAASQTITQTLMSPGAYIYSFSAYIRSNAQASVLLLLGSTQLSVEISTTWNRFILSGQGDKTALSTTFGLSIPAGLSIDVFGMQVEAQPAASAYKPSTTGGVYANAYFRDDTLSFTSTDLNHHSTILTIRYANRL